MKSHATIDHSKANERGKKDFALKSRELFHPAKHFAGYVSGRDIKCWVQMCTLVCLFGLMACGEQPLAFKTVEAAKYAPPGTGDSTLAAEINGERGGQANGGGNGVNKGSDANNSGNANDSNHQRPGYPVGGGSDGPKDGRTVNPGFPGSSPSGPHNPNSPSHPANPSLPPDAQSLALNWTLPCAAEGSRDAGRIIGGGRHLIQAGGAQNLAVSFSGSVCQPISTPRDLVFVVDVTGSMGEGSGSDFNHDPHRNGTCGRLEAVRRVLAMIPADGSAHVSLLTFNSWVTAQSSRFFTSGDALIADLEKSKGRSFDNIVCASEGGTDYAEALNGARRMIKKSARGGAQKQIYFITDGLPTLKNGVKEAAELRQSGSIIAPIMLIGDETILRDKIASRDAQDRPLFRKVQDASKLADALAELSVNHLTKVELRYKPLKSAVWWTSNVRENLNKFAFILPPINFNLQLDTVFEVVLDALDSRGNHSTISGQVEAIVSK